MLVGKAINLPAVDTSRVAGLAVLVRADLEADSRADPRFVAAKSLVEKLKQHQASAIKVLGHKGRVWMVEELGVAVNYEIRSDPREKENSWEMAAELAEGYDMYVNEAFGTSHRKHASLDALPRLMRKNGKQAFAGPRFIKEAETLSRVFYRPGKKALVVGGGSKAEDKENYVRQLEDKFDVVFRGGLLPGVDVRPDGLDISDAAITDIKTQIANFQVIVAAGVMGKYEDANAERGTREVLTAIADSPAYKVAGGGDIEAAIAKYGLTEKFDWISVGGGAMLEYLATGTLPGIAALLD